MFRFISSLVMAALMVAGCMAPVRLQAPVPAVKAGALIAEGHGRAQISVQWPEASRQVQAIPQEAALAQFEVFDASESHVASGSVTRQAGQVESSVALDLPVGSGYYLAVDVDAPNVRRIATGRSLAFEVRRNQTVAVPVTVQPLIKTFFGPLMAYNANGATTPSSGFSRMWTLAVGSDDTLYYADFSNHAIRAVSQDGVMRVVVGQVTDTSTQSQGVPSIASPDNSGDGGPAANATCRIPHGVYVSPGGDLFFADTLTLSPVTVRLRMVPATSGPRFGQDRQAGYVYTLRTLNSVYSAIGMVQDTDGSLLYTEQGANTIWRMSTDGSASIFIGNATGSTNDGLAPAEVSLLTPYGLARDARGNLFYSEYNGSRVRMLCRVAGTYFGTAMEAGKVYTVMDGASVKTQLGLASLPKPRQLAIGRDGTCYVVDNQNYMVLRIDATKQVTRLAGGTKTPNNSLEVGDEGLPASASFNLPHGLAIDSRNRLYVGDTYNGRIRWLHL